MDAFLREMKLHPQCVDVPDTARAFAREMRRGLSGEKSSLMMLKTYLSAPEAGRIQGRAAAVDIGGTNLRAARVEAHSGALEILSQTSGPVPGLGVRITKEAFFDEIARRILPVAEGGKRLGVAFSHSAEILPSGDGRVLSLSKEMRVIGIEGAEVCREICLALRRMGANVPERCVLLNDTTAVALAAAGRAGEDAVALVLGTGLNICYFDRGEGMFVNTEAAGFDVFPRGAADVLLDAGTSTPGEHLLEKAAAGRYIGGLVLAALRLAAREGLLTPRCAEGVLALGGLSAAEVSAYLAGETEGDALRALCAGPEDAQAVAAIVDAVLERAARLVASAATGVLLHTGAGASPERPAVLSCEGSVICRMPTFKERVEKVLVRETAGKLGRHCRAAAAGEDAVICGAALAALMD